MEKHLKNVKKYAIGYLKKLIEKYGEDYPRKTRIKAIEEIDRRAIETKEIKVGFDLQTGFVGTKVSGPSNFPAPISTKSSFSPKMGPIKWSIFLKSSISKKRSGQGLPIKKRSSMSSTKTGRRAKSGPSDSSSISSFSIKPTVIWMKTCELEHFSVHPDAIVELYLPTLAGKKPKTKVYSLKDVPIKGVQTKGVRTSNLKIKKVITLSPKESRSRS